MQQQVKCALMVLSASYLMAGVSLGSAAEYRSPVAMAKDPKANLLWIAQATANRIALVDLAENKIVKEIKLDGPANGFASSPDGRFFYVTVNLPEGQVAVIRRKKRKVIKRWKVGHSPIAPVVAPDGKTLFVCNRFNDNISAIDTASGKTRATIAVTREPIAAVITADGNTLFVANHLPAGSGTNGYQSAVISVVDVRSGKVTKEIKLPNGSTSMRDLCLPPDGKYAYATHILGRYQFPTTQLTRGWMNTNAFTIIDTRKQEYLNTVLLDDVDLGAANPWGIACSDDGHALLVAHAGTHEVSVIDRKALHEKLAGAMAGDAANSVPNDLTFLTDLRRRVALPGKGPRGLCVVEGGVFAAEYYSDTIARIDLKECVAGPVVQIGLGKTQPLSQERLGELYFNDADVCFQKWQSCASCHPDTRADALNWDLLNDGMGNPKQTKSLLRSHETPPAMVSGIRPSAEVAVRAGIKYIQFAHQPEAYAQMLDAYLRSVEPVPSPARAEGKLSKSGLRGYYLFSKAECAECHTGRNFTNQQQYKLGHGTGIEKEREFDVPGLVEVWRTAPYLYDGRAATLREVLTIHNSNDRHGKTSHLSEREIDDLVEYLKSL